MNMRNCLKHAALGSIILIAGMAQVATAGVGVDVSAPNVRVQVNSPQPPPSSRVTVVERERVVVRDGDRHDNGKHKGHYKKHKKDKKHRDRD